MVALVVRCGVAECGRWEPPLGYCRTGSFDHDQMQNDRHQRFEIQDIDLVMVALMVRCGVTECGGYFCVIVRACM